MAHKTPEGPKSPESVISLPEVQVVDETRGGINATLGSLYDGIVTAQQLIGDEPDFMEFDPKLIELDVAKRHGDTAMGASIRGWQQGDTLYE